MFCINLASTDPFFNLAIEELLLKNRTDDFLILGINDPSVIIGKHQAPYMEIDTKFVTGNKIPVIRRISGGGTVFHDRGNLNFTFICQSEAGKQIDFRKYTLPVISFLSYLGIEAKFEGKNDIKVNGLKISGNAEHVHRKRVLHHGTLLFSSSMQMLRGSLRKDTSVYDSRAVRSNPSSVTNLKDMLPEFRDIVEFRSEMMKYLMKNLPGTIPYTLSENENNEAESIAVNKYRTWEWNYGYGPEYQFTNRFELGGRMVSCRLYVREGTIRDCILEGSSELSEAGKKLSGCRHMVEELHSAFKKMNFNVSDSEIFNFF